MVNNLTILTHTHTDCSDILEAYFDSYKKFFNQQNHKILLNKKYDLGDFNSQILYYNEKQSKHSDRFLQGLNSIDTEYVIISMEDMILINEVDQKEIERVIKFIKYTDALCVRLLKSGINVNSLPVDKNLYEITSSDFKFSITPTIWNRNKLISILEREKGKSVWELEIHMNNTLNINQNKSYYWFDNEPKRGRNHFDSKIYPHICSAIFKGKWNTKEYLNELIEIFKNYEIDYTKRGIV